MTVFKKAGKIFLAAIDQATREKWKKFKGQNLFKDAATEMIEQLLEEAHDQVPASLAEPIEQASEAGGKLLMGAFEAAYETVLDHVGKWLEQTAGEDSKAILERVLLMDSIDRIAHAVAYKTILEAVDKETWAQEKNQVWKQIAGQFDRLARDFFEKGLSKKAKKQVEKVNPEDWGDKLKEAVVQAALPVQKTNLPKILEEFKRYAKQLSSMLGEEGQEEQKAATIRFSSMDPVLFERYLDACDDHPPRAMIAVKPQHLADFTNTILSRGPDLHEAWQIAAENIEHLIGPESHLYYADVVDVMDGLDVGIATAEKLFEKYVAGKEVVAMDVSEDRAREARDKVLKLGLDASVGVSVSKTGALGVALRTYGKGKELTGEQLEEISAAVDPVPVNYVHSPELPKARGKESAMAEKKNQKKTATAKKVAKLVEAGFAPPVLPGKNGEHWVPDLSDPTTRKAFFDYAKKFGLPEKEVLAKILSVDGNKEVFKQLKAKQADCAEPHEHEAAGYPDTQAGALRFADENIEGFEEASNISAVPSADDEFVWLVFNHDANQAFVADLNESEVEIIDYAQSLEEVKQPQPKEARTMRRGRSMNRFNRRRVRLAIVIPPQKSISEDQFWGYVTALKGNAERVLKVVPAEYWNDFSNVFGDLWTRLRKAFERLGMIRLTDSSLDFAANGVIRKGQNTYYSILERAQEAGDTDDSAAQKVLGRQLKKYDTAAGEAFAYPIQMLPDLVAGELDEDEMEEYYVL